MDTTLLWTEKRVFNAIGIALNFFVIGLFAHSVFMPIMAKDLVAKLPTPTLDVGSTSMKIIAEYSTEIRSKEFDAKIKNKYPKAIIVDVDSGIKHIKLTNYYDGRPVKINVVEIDNKLAKKYELVPALASNTLNNREQIGEIARENNSIIALNGTFFKPQTGVPLGTLMINEKIYTGPIYDRVAMGIFEDGYDVARVKLDAKITSKNNTVRVDNINQPRMLATYVLVYTSDWGVSSPPTPKYGLQLAVEKDRIIKKSAAPLDIPHNGYVIAGPASLLSKFEVGENVNFDILTNPEWQGVKHIISGGPYLVKDGEVFVDMTAEKLGAIGGKNPRSAIGFTPENNLILVAVDGREGHSVGMTLMQLARFMKSIGCVQAINLDGGGSTVMYVNGEIVNSPQQKGGIPISNAILFKEKS
ncbi:MAG: phosphodiester glycosidase family protein [Cyanobacteria bacterium SIG32]|nr:phosphodiester glycosidase family protein [Cyanobacteria bacterium SIG32]